MTKKQIIITIISIVTLAIVSGGVFWYVNKGNEEVVVILEDDNEEEVVEEDKNDIMEEENWDNAEVWPKEEFTEADYEGWKEYVNEEFGYKLKYPKNWTPYDMSNSLLHIIDFRPPNAENFISYMGIGLDKRGKDLDLLINSLSKNSKVSKIKFNNKEAYQSIHHDSESNYYHILIADKSDIVYTITTYKYNLPEIKQIFASFQFIN